MSTIEEIEQAVTQLTPAQLAKFRKWFAKYDAEVWDEKIEVDAKSDRLEALADAAIAARNPGETKES